MEKIKMSNVSLVITLRCSLKCKLCTAFAPYYETPPHYSFETIKNSIDKYFEIVEYVDKFTINGGEVLLHKNFDDIVEYLYKYIDHIGMLEFLTNGTLVPSSKTLQILAKTPKVDIMINNYGDNISKKVPEIVGLLEEYGIKYRLREQNEKERYCGGWVDITDLSKKNRTVEQTNELFANCVYPGAFRCFAIFGDKAYICGVYLRCKETGIIADNVNEYVDFSIDSSLTCEERKKKILNFFDKPHFSSCEFCNGFCPQSERFMPAEQL